MLSNIQLISFLAVIVVAYGCTSPTVTPQTYTSKEDISSSRTVFIAQFSLQCQSGSNDINLFAEVGDNALAVSRSSDGKMYQVSWSEEHKNAGSGTYTVRLYDEAGFSSMRKAQRSGEDATAVKPLATIDVTHQGVWKGPWVSSETVACLAAVLLFYCAYTTKSVIMS